MGKVVAKEAGKVPNLQKRFTICLQSLAPRNGYLPLLADSIKPHFQSALPPGSDTIWFDYEGLPLKWYVELVMLLSVKFM
jgi:hypothetical protein